MSESDNVGRRGFVATVGVAAGAAGVVVGGGAAVSRALSIDTLSANAERHTLLGIGSGDTVGRYRVRSVHAPRFGAVPVVLENEAGEPFQLDVLLRDQGEGAVLGVGNSGTLSVFLVNGGDGRTATAEQDGLGAMDLADALRAREEGAALPAGLLTFRERSERHPLSAYGVPLL